MRMRASIGKGSLLLPVAVAFFAGMLRQIHGPVALSASSDGAIAQSAAQADRSGDGIFDAVQRNAVADVQRLLAGGSNANAVNADGTPLVMAAALSGDAAMVELLLKRGADP